MKYPIGIQTFEKLRKEGCVYVDKTEQIYRLATGGSYYFLSRPRRFGKSLLLSTMEAYFSGRKDLFEGLAIERLERDWIEYPVLYIDFNAENYTEEGALERRLNKTLAELEKKYGANPDETSPALRLEGLIKRAYELTSRPVVILIDEYDKALFETIDNPQLHEKNKNDLRSFYTVLKSSDKYIRFAFLTGVTKFGHLNIFSGLNNLEDISMRPQYADICGITETELHTYFEESIIEFAESTGITYDCARARLKEQYDGYHFFPGAVGVYNPFSLLNALKYCMFEDYWFETGTPTFLVKLLQNSDYALGDVENAEQSAAQLRQIDSMNANPIPLLYQTGYLTIRGYNDEDMTYKLGYPNGEVERGFTEFLLPYYFTLGGGEQPSFFVDSFIRDVRGGDAEGFMKRLQALFADNDYKVIGKMEKYFHNSLDLIFKMMGFRTEVERATSRGCADIVIQTRQYVYVIEVKLDGDTAEALRQIDDKGYAERFASDPRQLFKIGVNFSSATRGIENWEFA